MDYTRWCMQGAKHVVWFDYSSLNEKFRNEYYCQVAVAAKPGQTYPDGPILTMHVTIPIAETGEIRSFCGPFYVVLHRMRQLDIEPEFWLGTENYYVFVGNFYAYTLSRYNLSWISLYMQDLQPIENVYISNLISEEVGSDLGSVSVFIENDIEKLYFSDVETCTCDLCSETTHCQNLSSSLSFDFDSLENQMAQSFV